MRSPTGLTRLPQQTACSAAGVAACAPQRGSPTLREVEASGLSLTQGTGGDAADAASCAAEGSCTAAVACQAAVQHGAAPAAEPGPLRGKHSEHTPRSSCGLEQLASAAQGLFSYQHGPAVARGRSSAEQLHARPGLASAPVLTGATPARAGGRGALTLLVSPTGATPAPAGRGGQTLTLPYLGETPSRDGGLAAAAQHGCAGQTLLGVPTAAAGVPSHVVRPPSGSAAQEAETLVKDPESSPESDAQASASAQPNLAPMPGGAALASSAVKGHASPGCPGASAEAAGRPDAAGAAAASRARPSLNPSPNPSPGPVTPSRRRARGSPLSPVGPAEARTPARLDSVRLDALLSELGTGLRYISNLLRP